MRNLRRREAVLIERKCTAFMAPRSKMFYSHTKNADLTCSIRGGDLFWWRWRSRNLRRRSTIDASCQFRASLVSTTTIEECASLHLKPEDGDHTSMLSAYRNSRALAALRSFLGPVGDASRRPSIKGATTLPSLITPQILVTGVRHADRDVLNPSTSGKRTLS